MKTIFYSILIISVLIIIIYLVGFHKRYEIIEIDGCEYIHTIRNDNYTHKGNCKNYIHSHQNKFTDDMKGKTCY